MYMYNSVCMCRLFWVYSPGWFNIPCLRLGDPTCWWFLGSWVNVPWTPWTMDDHVLKYVHSSTRWPERLHQFSSQYHTFQHHAHQALEMLKQTLFMSCDSTPHQYCPLYLHLEDVTLRSNPYAFARADSMGSDGWHAPGALVWPMFPDGDVEAETSPGGLVRAEQNIAETSR